MRIGLGITIREEGRSRRRRSWRAGGCWVCGRDGYTGGDVSGNTDCENCNSTLQLVS